MMNIRSKGILHVATIVSAFIGGAPAFHAGARCLIVTPVEAVTRL